MRWISLLLAIVLPLLFGVTASAQNVEYVSSDYWTNLRDMKIVDTLAYCAYFNGLQILNVSDPRHPTFISELYCHGKGQKIDVSGDYAYLMDGFTGIQIIDISDPQNPVLAGNYGDVAFWYYEIQVDGNYLYFTVPDSVLHVVNISDPANPYLAGVFNAPYRIRDFYIVGNLAYLSHDYELDILDLSDLPNPTLVGSYVTDCMVWEIQVVGDYAYIRKGEYEGCQELEIVDVSDPQNPSFAANIEFYALLTSFFISGDKAFIILGNLSPLYSWLTVFDISNPGSPVNTGLHYVSNGFGFMFAKDFYVYVIENAGLRVLDISRTQQYIVPVGKYDLPGESNDVFVKDGYAYVAMGSYGRGREIRVVDVSNPYNPIETGSFPLKAYGSDIYAVGDYAFIAQSYHSPCWEAGLQIVDISDPYEPVASRSLQTAYNATGVFVDGDYCYLSLSESGFDFGALQIADISDPGNPVLAGNYEIESGVMDVVAAGDYAYISEYPGNADSGSFSVVNVSDPYNPIWLSSYVIDDPWDIFVDGIYAYIVDSHKSLIILDISDPMNPDFVGSYPCKDTQSKIFVSNGYAYMGGLRDFFILDVHNPGQPTMVCGYPLPGPVEDIFVDGQYIYVADGFSLMILRFDPFTGLNRVNASPLKSVLSRNYPNPFNAYTIIQYDLPYRADVKIDIYDILGRRLSTLQDGPQPAGYHRAIWNAEDVSSGIYFYKIQAGGYTEARQMLLLK